MSLVAVGGDGGYELVSVNPSFLRVTGYHAAQVIHAPMERVIPRANVALVRSQYERAITSRQPVVYEEEAELPAGRRHAEITLIPIFEGAGPVTHILGDIRDVTARRWRSGSASASYARWTSSATAGRAASWPSRGIRSSR